MGRDGMNGATSAHDTDSEVLDFDAPACWICLGPATPDSPLERPCKCPRDVHLRCLSRWCLQQAGRKAEKECRFCFAQLPDWKVVLAPKGVRPADPIMIVTLGNQVHRIKVRPGEEGQLEFKRTIRTLFGIPEDVEFEVSFRCQAPSTSDTIQLEGMSSFDAVTHCASLAAAQRLAAGRNGQNNSAGSKGPHQARATTTATTGAAPAGAAAGPSTTGRMSGGGGLESSCLGRPHTHLAHTSRAQPASASAAELQGAHQCASLPAHYSSSFNQRELHPVDLHGAGPSGMQGVGRGFNFSNSSSAPFCSNIGHQYNSYTAPYLPQPMVGVPGMGALSGAVPQAVPQAPHHQFSNTAVQQYTYPQEAAVPQAVPDTPRQQYTCREEMTGPLPATATAGATNFPSSIFATASALAGAALAAGTSLFGGLPDVPASAVQQHCMQGSTHQQSLFSSLSTQLSQSLPTMGAQVTPAWSQSLGSEASLLSYPVIPSSPTPSSPAGAADMSLSLHAQLLGSTAQLRKQQYKALRAMDSSTDLAHMGGGVPDGTACAGTTRQVKQRRHTIDTPPAASEIGHMEAAAVATPPRRSPRILGAAK